MIDANRRTLLKGSLAVGSVGALVATGLATGVLAPRLVLADWNQAAFAATDRDAALKALLGDSAPQTNEAVLIKVPDIAENGAVVPVTVEINPAADLQGVTAIAILAAGNDRPLIASYVLGPAALPFVSTRIKMAKTADVVAVVTQGERFFSNAKNVKVTIGGCGS